MSKFSETAAGFCDRKISFGTMRAEDKDEFLGLANEAEETSHYLKLAGVSGNIAIISSTKAIRLHVQQKDSDSVRQVTAIGRVGRGWKVGASEINSTAFTESESRVASGDLEFYLFRLMKLSKNKETAAGMGRAHYRQARRAAKLVKQSREVKRQKKAHNKTLRQQKKEAKKSHLTVMRSAFAKVAEANGFKAKSGMFGLGNSKKVFANSKGATLQVNYKGGWVRCRIPYRNLEGETKYVRKTVKIKNLAKNTGVTEQSLEAQFRKAVDAAISNAKGKHGAKIHAVKKASQKQQRRQAREKDDQDAAGNRPRSDRMTRDHDDGGGFGDDDIDGDGGGDDGGDFDFGLASVKNKRVKGKFKGI